METTYRKPITSKEEEDDSTALENLAAAFQKRSREETEKAAVYERLREDMFNNIEEQNIFLRIPTDNDTLWKVVVKVIYVMLWSN